MKPWKHETVGYYIVEEELHQKNKAYWNYKESNIYKVHRGINFAYVYFWNRHDRAWEYAMHTTWKTINSSPNMYKYSSYEDVILEML